MPAIFPELRWAQRSSATEAEKNKLWITVAVSDLIEANVETTDTTFKFTGKDAEREYAVELELFAEIDSNLTRKASTGQGIVVELRKKKLESEYWTRLTKDSKRRPFIRTDFNKWVDEDEQEEAPEQDPMAGLGGMGGLGGAGAGGEGGGIDMAQLQQLQAALGQGGGDPSMAGLSGLDGEDSEDENDETSGTKLGGAQD